MGTTASSASASTRGAAGAASVTMAGGPSQAAGQLGMIPSQQPALQKDGHPGAIKQGAVAAAVIGSNFAPN